MSTRLQSQVKVRNDYSTMPTTEIEDMREFWVKAAIKYTREGNRVDFIRSMSNLAELYTEFERQQLNFQVLST